jgi:hypothetical protein
MKKFTIILLASMSMIFVSCKESASSKIKSSNLESAEKRDAIIDLGSAIMEFDQTVFDFGTIQQGDVVEGNNNKCQTELWMYGSGMA